MNTVASQLRELSERAIAAIEGAGTPADLESTRIAYLGKKGELKKLEKSLFSEAKTPDEKRAVGEAFNPIVAEIRKAHEARAAKLGSAKPKVTGPTVDITTPGTAPKAGHLHPLTATLNDLIAIFRSMGFDVEDGPEVEDEWHGFDALNIPEGHLARDPEDNFVLGGGLYLRSQTSNCQVRVMQRQKPPIRCIVPGRVYRPDTVDATHHFMFHQVEGLVVGEGVTFADLKHVLGEFLRAFYAGQEFEWRLRPHFFPFTEPSAEVDARIKGAAGQWGQWLEMLGCGMVDPNVLEAVGIDAEVYTGYAFGIGIERIAMLRHGITDLRHFFENDVRFLRQF